MDIAVIAQREDVADGACLTTVKRKDKKRVKVPVPFLESFVQIINI